MEAKVADFLITYAEHGKIAVDLLHNTTYSVVLAKAREKALSGVKSVRVSKVVAEIEVDVKNTEK